MATRDELVALVETFWHTLYVERDLDAVGAMFTDDGFYTDVPIDDGGATGPRRSRPGCASGSVRSRASTT